MSDQHFHFALDVETHDGVKVPIGLEITYPEDYGHAAIQALNGFIEEYQKGDYATQIVAQMLQRGDMSIIKALARAKDAEEALEDE
jgi:hypothetical protein